MKKSKIQSTQGQEPTLKVYMPIENYIEKKGKDGETEYQISGRCSDTAIDRDGDRISLELLQEWADKINNSEVGLGCFPDHNISIDNMAAIHKKAEILQDNEGINYLKINSLLNPAHEKFEYYQTCFKMNAPFFYSICVYDPLFREPDEGGRIIVGGDLVSTDFVPIPANPRTYVSQKGGSLLLVENYAGSSREEDIMNKETEDRFDKIEKTLDKLAEAVNTLAKKETEEQEKKEAKKAEEAKEKEKSAIDTILAKFDEMNQKIEKIGSESTGRDSGAPHSLSDITQKEYDDLSDQEKGFVWQRIVKGEPNGS